MARNFALILAAASGVSSLALRDSTCTFTMDTAGAVSYPVGQHSSGQARAGSDLTPTQFTLNGSSLTDSEGRGCWWTPPTKVLQCDTNQIPETGFAIGCNGTVSFNGQTTFYECDAGEKNEVNIYLEFDEDALNCKEITLTANGCLPGSCSASSSSACAPATTTTLLQPTVSTVYSTIQETIQESCPAAQPSISTVVTTVTEIVTNYATETVPGPTQTLPGSTVTISGPTETVTGPTEVVSAPTETVSGPTETVQTTLTKTPLPSYPATSPQPTTLTSIKSKPSVPATSATSSPSPTNTTTTISTPGQTSSSSFPQPSEVNIPSSCPGNVSNAGEFNLPALIIPVDSAQPDVAAGTSYFGEVSANTSSAFDFNIPTSASGKTCNLLFLFPEQDTLETSSYTFSGSGELDFGRLSEPVDQQTSYANLPSVAQDLGTFTVGPGNAYTVSSFDCPAGEQVSFLVADAEGSDTSLRFFQDYNPCPIGLFITTS